MSVYYMNHPLIRHKITLLRDERTGTSEFRRLVEEIAMLMGYEALSDLETRDIEIKTPIEDTVQPVLDGKKPAVVPFDDTTAIFIKFQLHLMCDDNYSQHPRSF